MVVKSSVVCSVIIMVSSESVVAMSDSVVVMCGSVGINALVSGSAVVEASSIGVVVVVVVMVVVVVIAEVVDEGGVGRGTLVEEESLVVAMLWVLVESPTGPARLPVVSVLVQE